MSLPANKKAILAALLLISSQIPSQALAANGENGRAIIGMIGGILGGVAAAQGGGRGGNPGAIFAGAIVGSLIGSNLGNDLDDSDRESCREAQERSLRNRGNGREDWRGDRGDAYGNFSTTRDGYNSRTGEYCREYRSEIYAGGRNEIQSGVACSRADGSYYEAQNSEVNFDGNRDSNRGDFDRDDRGGNRGDFDRGDRGDRGRFPDRGGPRGPGGPGGWQGGPGRGPRFPGQDAQGPSVPPPPPIDNYGPQASAQVSSISRRTGGEWVRLQFDRAVSLSEVQVRVLSAGLVIHQAIVYGESGYRTPVQALNETRTLYAGEVLRSEALRLRERVTTVDLRVESMGGAADALFSVSSQEGGVNLSVSRF